MARGAGVSPNAIVIGATRTARGGVALENDIRKSDRTAQPNKDGGADAGPTPAARASNLKTTGPAGTAKTQAVAPGATRSGIAAVATTPTATTREGTGAARPGSAYANSAAAPSAAHSGAGATARGIAGFTGGTRRTHRRTLAGPTRPTGIATAFTATVATMDRIRGKNHVVHISHGIGIHEEAGSHGSATAAAAAASGGRAGRPGQ